MGKSKDMLYYRNKPLVRSGKTIYYGDVSDSYVAMLQVLSTKETNGIELADKVSVQILSTDVELKLKDRIIKKAEKPNIYEALNIACIWLDRIAEKE